MSKMFQSQPGMVKILDLGEGGTPGVLSVTGKGSLAKQEGVVITGVGVNQQVNAQFMASLQKVIYVYSFGDKMGQVTVNGLAFFGLCKFKKDLTSADEEKRKTAKSGYLGATSLLQYYDSNRAVEEDRLMKVIIGDYAIQGYMISMNLNTASTEFKTMAFTLNIVTVPKQVGLR